jgi:hypothetical protein
MTTLNFPPIKAKVQKGLDGRFSIYDIVRNKFVLLTPEEWVRQHVVHWLNTGHNLSLASIAIEKQLVINERKKRFDILYYKNGKEHLLIECKAPEVKLSNATCHQIAVYNKVLNAPLLMITNGIKSILFEWSEKNQKYSTKESLYF